MATTTGRVSRRDGVKNGRPTVRESKLSVAQLVELTEEVGLSPAEVVGRYPDVDSDAVRDALAWAEDNPDEVKRLRRERDAASEVLDRVTDHS